MERALKESRKLAEVQGSKLGHYGLNLKPYYFWYDIGSTEKTEDLTHLKQKLDFILFSEMWVKR